MTITYVLTPDRRLTEIRPKPPVYRVKFARIIPFCLRPNV